MVSIPLYFELKEIEVGYIINNIKNSLNENFNYWWSWIHW